MPHTQPQGQMWPTLLHFTSRSNQVPDADTFAAVYYFEFKSAVYENLFVGIVYGKGTCIRESPVSESSYSASQVSTSYSTLPRSTSSCELCALEGRTAHADSTMAFRSRPGFTSSTPRKVMLGITTFMFVLGIVTLVLETAFVLQGMQLYLDPTAGNVGFPYRANVINAVGATSSRLMVRLHDSHTVCSGQLTAFQYILSDSICAWRAVVLWNRDKHVVAILLLFILGTTGT